MTLAYVKFINKKTAIEGPEIDLIELANIIMDHAKYLELDPDFRKNYLSSLYYKILLPFPSLFFFRSRHLFETLELMVNDDEMRREKNFWLKSEDLVIRVKG